MQTPKVVKKVWNFIKAGYRLMGEFLAFIERAMKFLTTFLWLYLTAAIVYTIISHLPLILAQINEQMKGGLTI